MLKIVRYGSGKPNVDKILHTKASKIVDFKDLRKKVFQMYKVMKLYKGVGIAGPQVNYMYRLILVDYFYLPNRKSLLALVNPVIKKYYTDNIVYDTEGCLSIPDITGSVKRSYKIEVSAQDIYNNKIEFSAFDFLARIIQHEVDHLNGILFIDKLDTIQRKEILNKNNKDIFNRAPILKKYFL